MRPKGRKISTITLLALARQQIMVMFSVLLPAAFAYMILTLGKASSLSVLEKETKIESPFCRV